ncbi:hypothetical protein ASF18_21875 [Methylobacterium sp. Leaf89]|nr:hypothetical protein ASF18_21875 [Methylobacterium sp. Leaf89]
MRGLDRRSGALFSYVDLEARVRSNHPMRAIRQLTDEALTALSGSFSAFYLARMSRPSIPPVTTRRDREVRPAPDLVDRNFAAVVPNQF